MTGQTILDEPTWEQLELLRCLFTLWSPNGAWPSVQDVDRWFRHRDMPTQRARAVMDSFPVVGDTRKGQGLSYSAIWYDPNHHSNDAVVRMTFAAGLHLPEFGTLVESYVGFFKGCAKAVREALPGSGHVEVDNKAAQRIVRHRDHGFIPTMPDMFHYEPIRLGTKTWENDGSWAMEISDEIHVYADIQGMRDYVLKTVELMERENKAWQVPAPTVGQPQVSSDSPATSYVSSSLIDELVALEQDVLHTGKLLGLLRELNDNFGQANPYACLMLYRAVIDCVPPVFGVRRFSDVANTLQGITDTDKQYLRALGANRPSAGDALHRQIRKSADLISMNYLPPNAAMDALIRLVVDRLAANTGS